MISYAQPLLVYCQLRGDEVFLGCSLPVGGCAENMVPVVTWIGRLENIEN
jgi:hypothetical protein